METKKRSWMKSLTWRIIGIVLLGAISYFVTGGDLKETSLITVLFHTIRMVLYYYHERIWIGVKWGRIRHPLEAIPVKGPLSQQDLDIIREKLKGLGYIE